MKWRSERRGWPRELIRRGDKGRAPALSPPWPRVFGRLRARVRHMAGGPGPMAAAGQAAARRQAGHGSLAIETRRWRIGSGRRCGRYSEGQGMDRRPGDGGAGGGPGARARQHRGWAPLGSLTPVMKQLPRRGRLRSSCTTPLLQQMGKTLLSRHSAAAPLATPWRQPLVAVADLRPCVPPATVQLSSHCAP